MAGFTITKVVNSNTPAGVQTKTFEYKLFSAPTWTLISASAAVNVNGTLVAPLVVNGLVAGNLYYVRVKNNCDVNPVYYTQQIQL